MIVAYHLQKRDPGTLAPSRRRSLLRDLSDGLRQQMYLWGCDVRSESGNLLVRHGLERLARQESESPEGTSRYRLPWEGGLIELHGFCAGWYPGRPDRRGVIFIRHRGRLDLCDGARPVIPGKYPDLGGQTTDALLDTSLPLVRWLVAYEEWIQRTAPDGYRTACWHRYLRLPNARPWLPPGIALRWLRQFASSPAYPPRARSFRTTHPQPSLHRPSTFRS